MIHVLNFSDEIIDYISASDDAVIYAEHERNLNEQVETFKFSVLSKRASNLQHRNRIIIQDSNSKYREFIIEHVEQEGSYTEVECVASYLEDIKKAKPIEPMVLSKKSTHESLEKILAGTGWQTSDLTEYGGNKTTTWKNYQSRYDSLLQLKTTFSMTLDFYIELGAHTVNGRFVVLKKKSPLFKGKEIVYGKDLAGMKRTLNMSEVKTALIAQGPEQDNGNRIILEVKDDEAQSQFGLPEHYLWDIYEPETDDQNMTETRLRTLATTELNKRKKQAVTYEVISIDVKKLYPQEEIAIGDLVRVKDQEFNPPLYLEGEVIGEKYDLISGQSEWVFGEYVEYEEKALKSVFERKLDAIRQKLNDNFSNVNTIVKESLQGELQYFERKILKGDTPPDNPVNDLLWLDTSNHKVAVLRRYWNGEWIKSSVENANDVGAITREKALYSELSNTFVNLTIQHSRLMHEVSDVLESEYLIDTNIKEEVNSKLNDTIGVFNTIKSNLDSMTEETATIGALVDTQALFLDYRAKMQALYNTIENAKIAIDERFKLLQSQYTDEKFNDAMDKIARTLPNGRWDSENQQLYADIPNRNEVENLKTTLQEYTDGQISNLNSVLGKEIDSKINTTKNEISASISSVERKIDGIEVGGRNLIRNSKKITDYIILASVEKAGTYSLGFEPHFTENIPSEFGVYYGGNIDALANDKPRITHTFEVSEDRIGKDIRLFFGGTYRTHKDFVNKGYISKVKLEYGDFATDWTPAPEDIEDKILNSKQEAEEAAKAYAKAQDELKQTEIQAYADGIVSDEEKRAIADAIAKRDEAKKYAEQKAQEAQEAANQNTSNVIKPITTRVTKNETNISELDKQISLMAKSDDVAQKLKDVDGRLTPLETDVKSNKATLNILPTQIDSKVSKRDYTLDKDNIVQRLNNADSERIQLSNKISDKVSLSELNYGIADAKHYADQKVTSNDYRLSQMETSISQNGREIRQRVSQQDFNASRKTLSQVVSEISATTKGINLSYDENGNIQSYTMDRNGIKIDGSKIDINQGDVIVQNGVTTIKDAYIDKLFSNQATIEYLKATDIDLNRATVKGSKNGESTILTGGKIRSTGSFVRTFPQGSVTYEAFTESWNGVYRSGLISKQFGNRKLTDIERWLALTDKTITTQREIHSMSPDKRGARFIDFFAEETYSSDVFGQGMHVYSGQDLKIEAGYRLSFESSNSWYTQFLGGGVEVVNDGASLVLKRQSGFTSQAGSGGQYIMLQAYDGAEHGHLGILSNNRHLSLKSSFGEVHLRGNQVKALNSEGNSLTTITASDFDISGVGRVVFENGDAYLQGQTGVRFTRYKSNTFVTAQAKDFVKASSRHLKTNIEDLKNGLETINQLKPVKYDYISDLQEGNTDGDIGFIAEDSPSISVNNGKAISVQKIATWAILGIQELSKENDDLQKQIADLKTKFDVLSEVIK